MSFKFWKLFLMFPRFVSLNFFSMFHIFRDQQPQINKQINFRLPFMGFGFNYTWLSLHGHLSFSNVPIQSPEYPLKFPIQVSSWHVVRFTKKMWNPSEGEFSQVEKLNLHHVIFQMRLTAQSSKSESKF